MLVRTPSLSLSLGRFFFYLFLDVDCASVDRWTSGMSVNDGAIVVIVDSFKMNEREREREKQIKLKRKSEREIKSEGDAIDENLLT